MTVPFADGMRYFDLYHGVELQPRHEGDKQRSVLFRSRRMAMAPFSRLPGDADAKIAALLAKMKAMTARPLSSYPHEWKDLPQKLVEIKPTAAAASAPQGMVKIPGGEFDFKVEGIEIEGHNDAGVDVQYPWEDGARRFHDHRLDDQAFLSSTNIPSPMRSSKAFSTPPIIARPMP